MAQPGYILSIDGLKYLLTTSGVTAGGNPTSTDASWFGPDTTQGGQFLDGVLDETKLQVAWSERARTTGGFACSFPSLPLHDVPIAAAPFNGAGAVTYLMTRLPEIIASTQLYNPCLATDATMDVYDASQLVVPGPVWIEREAVYAFSVTHHSGYDTLNLTGRGYLGTRAAAHTIDTAQGYAPEVFSDFPWAERRRCLLWRVTVAADGVTGTATVVHRGYLTLAPALDADSPDYVLAAEHVWPGMYAQLPAGDPRTVATLAGYNRRALSIKVTNSTGSYADSNTGVRPADAPVYADPGTAWNQAAAACTNQCNNIFAISGAYVQATATGSGYQIGASISGIGVFTLQVTQGDQVASVTASANTTWPSGDPHYAQVTIGPTPPSMIAFDPNGPPANFPINFSAGLPATWSGPSGSPWTDGPGLGTTIRPVLRGDFTDSQFLVLTPTTTNAPAARAVFPTVTAHVEVLPNSAQGQVDTFSTSRGGVTIYSHAAFIPGTVRLHYAGRVQCQHWAYGLQHAMGDPDVVRSQLDPRDFDWSTVPAVVDATLSATSARDWFFDGSKSWNDVAAETLMLEACVWSLRHSRLAIVPIAPPVAGATPAATLTTAMLVDGLAPRWSRATDEMITGEKISAPGLDLLVNNAQAAGRYLKGQIPEVTLDGNVAARVAATDAVTFARDVLHRITAWGKPLALVKIPCRPDDALDALFIGDYVDVSEWLLPTGDGVSYGLGNATALALLGVSTQRVQILGREVDDTASPPVVWLEGILWGTFASGYAPCCRVASISGAVLTIAGPGYADGSDYAGSDAAGYPGTANDGGTFLFKVNDHVELVQRGVATYTAFTAKVTAVNPAARTITLTAAPGGSWGTWAGAADTPVDLRYDHYSACNAQQLAYAFVGSNSPPFVIDSTSAKDKVFGP